MHIDDILMQVEKPARYIGGEWNACFKELNENMIRVAFCFPDVYEVAMSHLGLRILYEAINNLEEAYVERCFAPWIDFEEKIRENNIALFSLETKTPLCEFDIVAFTLQYEMSFTNILNMLNLGNIPLLKKDRTDEMPLVVCGGPCASNPESLTDIVDVFLIGDGEESLPNLVSEYNKFKKSGKSKKEFLNHIVSFSGVYVPEFYEITKNEQGEIIKITKNNDNAPDVVEKAIVMDLDNSVFAKKCIVPNMGIVHDRITLEIMRGCTRGCRFCQAGYLYRPIREKDKDKLISDAKEMVCDTGYDEISLSSLSSSDYSNIEELSKTLITDLKEKCVSVALPSLRLDNFSRDIIKNMPDVRKTGLTFAMEAGTQRLRDVINKNVTEDDLRQTVNTAFSLGWNRVKLYFMIGLPTETMEDIKGIVEMANIVAQEYEKVNGKKRGLTVTISTSTFVPKSFTPFQWYGQDNMDLIKQKQQYLKDNLKDRWFKYAWHDARISMLEAAFARGGRELCDVLYKAYQNGCKFDSWANIFDFDAWTKAFSDCGLDLQQCASKVYKDEEILPWEIISYKIDKKFLLKEKERAVNSTTMPDCRKGCHACGLEKVCKIL